MTFILRLVNRTIGLTLLAAAAALTTTLAIVLIAVQLIGEEELLNRVACHVGLSERCVREQLEDSQRELERQKRESERLRGEIAEMQKLFDRLADLDHAASSYVIFYHNGDGPREVVSGHRYASLLDPATLTAGWCYIRVDQGTAIAGSLHIASFESDLKLQRKTVSARDRGIADLTEGEIEEAHTRCHWPEGVS